VTARRERLGWWGTRHDQREAAIGLLLAAVATAAYVLVAQHAFDTPTTWLEITSLVLNLACVWLARTENVWTMPAGFAARAVMAVFLFRIELVGQAWLQLAFYLPVQLVGWWAWCRGGVDRTELPPTRLGWRGWVLAVGSGLVLWAATWALLHRLYGTTRYQPWDTSVVASSIVAQGLMTWKKAEQWLWWAVPVNVSSIGLYAATDSWAFTTLYTVFLANAVWGWVLWRRTIGREATQSREVLV
jgi:nicotinamide mononucleotide transporter